MTRLTYSAGNHTYWLADPDTGKRAQAPSVSGLKNTLYPFEARRWVLKEAGTALGDRWADLEAAAPPLRAELFARLAEERLDYGRNFGTAVHGYCESLWTGEAVRVPEEYAGHVEAVAEWWDGQDVSLVAAEAMCYADADDFGLGPMAGRFDLIVEHPRRGLGLVDLKTWTTRASGMTREAEWAFQLAAYAGMTYLVSERAVADDQGEVLAYVDEPFPPVAWASVLHVGPGGLVEYALPPDGWKAADEQVAAARALKSLPRPKMATL